MPDFSKRIFEGLDSNESYYLIDELKSGYVKILQKEYTSFKAKQMFPVTSNDDPADEKYTYQVYDWVGEAIFIDDYSDDLPYVEVFAEEFEGKIKSLGTAFFYSKQDIRRSKKTGKSLPMAKRDKARMAMEKKQDRIGFFGDLDRKVQGFLTHPNIQKTAATGAWSGLTAEQIFNDVRRLIDPIFVNTNQQEEANALGFTYDAWSLLNSTPYSSQRPEYSILDHIRSKYPNIEMFNYTKAFEAGFHPANANHPEFDGVNIIAAYRYDTDAIEFEIPEPYDEDIPEKRGQRYHVEVTARIAGFKVYKPFTINIMYGV